MLIFSRAVGEFFSIDHEINIRIISVNGNHVRIGVEAPKSVSVHRSEIYERLQKQEQSCLPTAVVIKS